MSRARSRARSRAEDLFRSLVKTARFDVPVHLVCDDATALAGRPEGGRACACAEVVDGEGRVYVTRRFLDTFSRSQQDGVLRHELGHIALLLAGDSDHSERAADEKAREVWGRRIKYDSQDIQTVGVGTWPRPARLDAGQNPARAECVEAMTNAEADAMFGAVENPQEWVSIGNVAFEDLHKGDVVKNATTGRIGKIVDLRGVGRDRDDSIQIVWETGEESDVFHLWFINREPTLLVKRVADGPNENPEQPKLSRLMRGFKVMHYDAQTNTCIAGADSRQSFEAQPGAVVKMRGNGIYLSLNRQYVIDHYSRLADHEALLTFEFDPDDVTSGNLTDHDTEFSVSKATLVDVQPFAHASADDPDYNWYVVFDGKIAAGNEYRSDAEDARREIKREGRTDAKVVSRRTLGTKYMLDPKLADHWHGSEYPLSPPLRPNSSKAVAVLLKNSPDIDALMYEVSRISSGGSLVPFSDAFSREEVEAFVNYCVAAVEAAPDVDFNPDLAHMGTQWGETVAEADEARAKTINAWNVKCAWSRSNPANVSMTSRVQLRLRHLTISVRETRSTREDFTAHTDTVVIPPEKRYVIDEWKANGQWQLRGWNVHPKYRAHGYSRNQVWFNFIGQPPPWDEKYRGESFDPEGKWDPYAPENDPERTMVEEIIDEIDAEREPEENPRDVEPIENPGAWHPARIHALFGYGTHIPKDAEDSRMYRGVRVDLRKSKATGSTNCRRCGGTGREMGSMQPCHRCHGSGEMSLAVRGGRGHRIVVHCPCGKTVGFGRVEQHARVCDDARATFYAPMKICNCATCAANLREYAENECPNTCKHCLAHIQRAADFIVAGGTIPQAQNVGGPYDTVNGLVDDKGYFGCYGRSSIGRARGHHESRNPEALTSSEPIENPRFSEAGAKTTADIMALYLEGVPLDEIARRVGVTYNYVTRVVPSADEGAVDTALEMWADGNKLEDIAARLGTDKATVFALLRKHGPKERGARPHARLLTAEIVSMYEGGATVMEIADKLNARHMDVFKIVREHAPHGTRRAVHEVAVPVDDLVRDFQKGASVRKLANKYGVAQSVVRARLNERGVLTGDWRQVGGRPSSDRAAENPAAFNVYAWGNAYAREHGLKTFDLSPTYESSGNLIWKLHWLIVPKSERKRGLGSKAVEALCAKADEHGATLVLNLSDPNGKVGTTSRSRLVRFYKRFGFVENRGRMADHSISEEMMRVPR